jgi:protein-S-isoprenylcysteine O-methyltransferase Ste14
MDRGSAKKPPLLGVGASIAAGVFALFVLVFAGLIFVPAGRADWAAGWACLAVMVIGFSAVTAHVAARTPSLVRRRAKPGAGTPLWDLFFVGFFQLAFVAVLVAGGLDAGRDPARALAPGVEGLGLFAMALAIWLLGWAMGRNPHFEATVRIQRDEHHRVVDRGPYRIVRHPGYVAGILLLFGMALALGSVRALVPASLGALGLVARTALEDAYLTANLAGYRAYAERTRSRLVPGVW